MNKLVGVAGVASVLTLMSCDPPQDHGWLGITDPRVRGEALASATCAPCHGSALNGASFDGTPTPSLVVARKYSAEQFDTLLTTGRTAEGHVVIRDMVWSNVLRLSPDERRAVREYLLSYWTP